MKEYLFKHHKVKLIVSLLFFLFFGKNLLANPLLMSTYPVDNANNISPLLESIELTFDRNVYVGSGNISLKRGSDDYTVQFFDIGSNNIKGNGSNKITITLVNSLTLSETYYLNVSSLAIQDINGNNFAGISNTSDLNFTISSIMPNPNDNNDLSGVIRSQLEASTRWIEQSIDPIMQRINWRKRNDRGRQIHSSNHTEINNYEKEFLNFIFPFKNKLSNQISNNFSLWTDLETSIGKIYSDNNLSKIDFDIRSVIFGADTSIDGVTAGFALRLSNELNSIGNKGTEVYVHGYSLTLYADRKFNSGFSLSYLAGFSDLDYNSYRNINNSTIHGSRDGFQIFQALDFSGEWNYNNIFIEPYAKIYSGYTLLESFKEDSLEYALLVSEQKVNHRKGYIGINIDKPIFTNYGFIRPNTSLELGYDFTNYGDYSARYIADQNTKYKKSIGSKNSYDIKLGLGLDFNLYRAWISTSYEKYLALGKKDENNPKISSDSINLKASIKF